MKALDRFLQRWRIAKTGPYIANGTRVLDVGCSDGALFRQLGSRIGEGVGIDPDLREPVELPGVHLLPGKCSSTFPPSTSKNWRGTVRGT
jgi:2-polyprenyl-3-methyl-5-hydroxy-6-metoxy-1,4-benzoquinol methylase